VLEINMVIMTVITHICGIMEEKRCFMKNNEKRYIPGTNRSWRLELPEGYTNSLTSRDGLSYDNGWNYDEREDEDEEDDEEDDESKKSGWDSLDKKH
jgi:hypothetical protein